MTAWDESFALDIQRRIARGDVDPADADRFQSMVLTAIDEANGQRTPEPERHPWTDQQAHDVYVRINRDPGSVTAQEADAFAAWAAEQSQPTLARGEVPPVPGPDASIEERNAYLKACGHAGVEPDPATLAAFHEQVGQALKDHTAELESRFPAGFFDDGRPRPPENAEAMREELHALYARQQEDPASVTDADWARINGQLAAMVDQHNTDQRRRQLPWVLPADAASDPGVEPGAVEAMTAPAPWTPRPPTKTEHALEELSALDQQPVRLRLGPPRPTVILCHRLRRS